MYSNQNPYPGGWMNNEDDPTVIRTTILKRVLILGLIMVIFFAIAFAYSDTAFSSVSTENDPYPAPADTQNLDNQVEPQTLQDQQTQEEAQAVEERKHQARMYQLEYQSALRQTRLDELYTEKAHDLEIKFQADRHASELASQQARQDFDLAERQRQANIQTIKQITLITTISLSLLSVFLSLAVYIYRRTRLLNLQTVVSNLQPVSTYPTLQQPIKSSRWNDPAYREAAINLARRNEYLKRQQALAQEKPAEEVLTENLASIIQPSPRSDGRKNGHAQPSYYNLPLAD